MTEAEWAASTDPAKMLLHLIAGRGDAFPDPNFRVSPRKLRLFACGCCRLVWDRLVDPRSRRAIEVAELYADGLATKDELSFAYQAGIHAHEDAIESEFAFSVARPETQDVLFGLQRWFSVSTKLAATQASILRSMVNPFRWHPARCELCHEDKSVEIEGQFYRDRQPLCFSCRNSGMLTLNNGLVLKLATAAYVERLEEQCGACKGAGKVWDDDPNLGIFENYRIGCTACNGTGRISTGRLDPDRLAILADALEDSGCQDEVILMPLRGKVQCRSCGGKGKRDCMVDAGYNNPLMKTYGWQWCYVCNDYGRGPTLGWIADLLPRFRGFEPIDLLLSLC